MKAKLVKMILLGTMLALAAAYNPITGPGLGL